MTKFNFRNFPRLSAIDRNQLGGVQDSLTEDPKQKRTALNRLIFRRPPKLGPRILLSDCIG